MNKIILLLFGLILLGLIGYLKNMFYAKLLQEKNNKVTWILVLLFQSLIWTLTTYIAIYLLFSISVPGGVFVGYFILSAISYLIVIKHPETYLCSFFKQLLLIK